MKTRFLSIMIIMSMTLTLLSVTVTAAKAELKDGWYYLRVMGNYVNIDASGNVELRDKTNNAEGNARYLVQFRGTNGFTLQTKDGKYLGLEIPEYKQAQEGTTEYFTEDKWINGARVKAVDPKDGYYIYHWVLTSENNNDIWSLRAREHDLYVMNASGEKNSDGTPIIMWRHARTWNGVTQGNLNAPKHGEFRFIPTSDPSKPAPGTAKTPKNGWYGLKLYYPTNKSRTLNIDASGNAELNYWNASTDGTRELYVENKGNNQITLKMADGRYLGIADTITDGVRVKAVNSPYLWNTYTENTGLEDRDKYSLRPSTDTRMVLNASGEKSEVGTAVILWTHSNMDAPSNAEFTFYATEAPDGVVKPKPATTTPKPISTPAPASVNAVPSKTNFVMNGKPLSVTSVYSINGSNYLPLREIATMLNGTAAQFDVGWDGKYAVIEPGKPYSGTVTEKKLKKTTNVRKSGTKFKMNGEVFTFTDARMIDGDTNYIQLSEFAQKLSGTASQFNVFWDGAAGQAVIQPGVAYTGVGS